MPSMCTWHHAHTTRQQGGTGRTDVVHCLWALTSSMKRTPGMSSAIPSSMYLFTTWAGSRKRAAPAFLQWALLMVRRNGPMGNGHHASSFFVPETWRNYGMSMPTSMKTSPQCPFHDIAMTSHGMDVPALCQGNCTINLVVQPTWLVLGFRV